MNVIKLLVSLSAAALLAHAEDLVITDPSNQAVGPDEDGDGIPEVGGQDVPTDVELDLNTEEVFNGSVVWS